MVDGSSERMHGVQLQGSTVVGAEADGIDMGENKARRVLVVSDADMQRGDVENIRDHVLEDDGCFFGRDLAKDNGESRECVVPSGVADSESG